ncbi:MAG: hypothetical protein D3924_18200 [Candidatus Electrothrix sp. AR4]|nr:hypothetical protein [Candidatus Electrothrix sp. AR4]
MRLFSLMKAYKEIGRAARKLGVTDRALQVRCAGRLRREQEEQVVYHESLSQQKQVAPEIPYMSQ